MSTIKVDWELKVKYIEYDVGLTKNYCITVNMQNISSIRKLIQQVLWSHVLNGHIYFLPCPPKNHWNNFWLSWISTRMQKISSFRQFIHEIQAVVESYDQAGHTHFRPTHPNFWSTFNLCKFVSTCKQSGYFIDLFWRYGWSKNPAIWLAENILAHVSGTEIFSKMWFVQEHRK